MKKQIEKLNNFQPDIASIFDILLKIVQRKDFQKASNSISSLFGENSDIEINSNLESKFVKNHLPIKHLLKIGLILLLCFASFMMNFHHQRSALKYDNDKAALNYDQNKNTENALKENEKFVKEEKFDDTK